VREYAVREFGRGTMPRNTSAGLAHSRTRAPAHWRRRLPADRFV